MINKKNVLILLLLLLIPTSQIKTQNTALLAKTGYIVLGTVITSAISILTLILLNKKKSKQKDCFQNYIIELPEPAITTTDIRGEPSTSLPTVQNYVKFIIKLFFATESKQDLKKYINAFYQITPDEKTKLLNAIGYFSTLLNHGDYNYNDEEAISAAKFMCINANLDPYRDPDPNLQRIAQTLDPKIFELIHKKNL